MKIIKDYPPLFELMDKAFSVKGKPILYTYGDCIYNPLGVDIAPELLIHEAVHSYRQGATPVVWWTEYLEFPEFRLKEELVAHQAEYAAFCDRYKDRNTRARYLWAIASRLSSPLYGRIISHPNAMKVILNADSI